MLNVILAGSLLIVSKSNQLNYEETKRIDQLRLDNIKLLGVLLKNRISKQEVLKLLQSQVSPTEYFDKPSEHVVGLGSVLLNFNKKGILEEILVSTSEGP